MVEIDDGHFAKTVARLLNEKVKKKWLTAADAQASWVKVMKMTNAEKKAWLASNMHPKGFLPRNRNPKC
jgi:hypothetical protein